MDELKASTTVLAAEISRNFGAWQDRASLGPVIVTHHGRPRIVLLPIDQFEGATEKATSCAETDLRAARVALLAEYISGGFIAFDKDRRITRVNTEAEIYLGKPASALLGKTTAEAGLSASEGPVAAAIDRVANGGDEVTIDAPSVTQPGRIQRVRVLPYPGGVATIFRNVAHEAKTDYEGHEMAALYAARDAHANIAVARLSLRGTFQNAEPGLARIVGLPPERLRGMKLTDLLIVKDRGRIADEIDAVLNGETRRFPARLIKEGGDEVGLCIAIAPIRENYGVIGAMIMLTVDEPY